MDFEEIRAGSVRRLEALGLGDPVAPLPLLGEDDVAWLRPVDQVVARCHAIAAAVALEEGGDAEEIAEVLREEGLERWLAGPERALLRHRLGEEELDERALEQAEIDVSWRKESLWALLWALGIVDGVELRPVEELAVELDFHYCLHWHTRDHRLEEREHELPEPLSEGFVRERRLPLEWLFADEDWEEISLDT